MSNKVTKYIKAPNIGILLFLLSLNAQAFAPKQKAHYKTEALSFSYEGREQHVMLGYSIDSIPLFYESYIITHVCSDSVCDVLHVNIYWDLTGNYLGFKTTPKHPLTKYNHQEFTQSDYQKLHSILMNQKSKLGMLHYDELIPSNNNNLDAHTGATSVDIADLVIKDAVYSCYTLWNIVNKKGKYAIQKHTTSQLNSLFISAIITSNDIDQVQFILNRLDNKDYQNYASILAPLLDKEIATQKAFIKKMPHPLTNNNSILSKLCQNFPLFDHNTKLVLLQKISLSTAFTSQDLKQLAKNLHQMTPLQTDTFASILDHNKHLINNDIIQILKAGARNNKFITDKYIDELSNTNPV